MLIRSEVNPAAVHKMAIGYEELKMDIETSEWVLYNHLVSRLPYFAIYSGVVTSHGIETPFSMEMTRVYFPY